MAYQLYFKKDECILEIKPLSSVFKHYNKLFTDESSCYNDCHYYNDCYYFSRNKEALKQLALDIQREWRIEAELRLQKVLDIKIK